MNDTTSPNDMASGDPPAAAASAGGGGPGGGAHAAIDTRWLDGLVGYRLRRASHAMAADFADAEIGRVGSPDAPPLRPVVVTMLGVLADNPGLGPSALGRLLGLRRANVVPLVAELVEAGLVERRASPTDGRAVELHLTGAGHAAAERGRTSIATHEARMTAGLSAAERDQLLDLLARIHRP